MPPLPRIRVPMLAELARELRFAPRVALLRAADRAEGLAPALTPGAMVPADWVVFKITGYRPERWSDDPKLAASEGGELRRGLSALVEFLTHQAAWSIAEASAVKAVTRTDLAKAWSVSERTIDRLRSEGLVARRALREDGKPVLVFLPSSVAWAGQAFADRLKPSDARSRLTAEQRGRIVRLAERLRRRYGCSLNQAAKALAPRFGRSLEAVRQVLRAEEGRRGATRAPAMFADPAPVEARRSGWMHRAWRRGADPSDIAEHAGCSRAAVQRAINLRRLSSLPTAGEAARKPVSLSVFDQAGAPKLSTFGVPGPTDLSALVASSRVRTVLGPRQEHSLLAMYKGLVEAGAAWAASTPHGNPQSEPLDTAETALRWAALVKVELMRPLLTLAVETVETVLGKPLETLGATDAAEILKQLLGVAADAIDHADPTRTGRLAGAAALALSTAASRWVKFKPAPSRTGTRASAALPSGIVVPDWTRRVASWQESVEPDPRIRSQLDRMPVECTLLLKLRFGWSGERPLTQSEAAARLGLSRIAMPRAERTAIRLGLALARGLGR